MTYRTGLWALLGMALLAPARAQDVPAELADDQCVVCHVDFGAMPDGFLMDNVHMRPELSCVGCHGGDASADDDEVAHSGSFVGVPGPEEIPEFCGKCHSDIGFMRRFQPSASTDQLSQYFTSVHGQKLRAGDEKVAECASCHTSHAILPASDGRSSVHPLNVPQMCNQCHGDPDYMAEYGIRTNQYRDYAKSVHGTALLEEQDTGSPACNDCHGNHGAMPPGLDAIENVCGMCHVNNAEYFHSTSMARAFEEEELHGCEECHGIHDVAPTSLDMIGTGDDSVCIACHDEGDDGYRVAEEMYAQLMTLVAAKDSAAALAGEVQRIGMDDVEIGYLQREANQSLIKARTLVHTFDPARTGEVTEEGIESAKNAVDLARSEIEAFRFRRMGFGVASLFITVLTVALFFKIRDIESRKDS